MLAGLLTRLQGWLLTAGAVLAILVGAYALGGRAARRSAAIAQKRRQEAIRARIEEVDRDIEGLDRDALDSRARQWVRDDPDD